MPVLQAAHPGLRTAPLPRLATMRRLAQRWRIRDGTLRTALSRACATGSLEAVHGGYRLGPRSEEEAAAARALLTREPGYTLCVVLEGARRDLASLRALLERLGFRPLQRSVWVGARTKTDRLGAALERERLATAAVVFHADEVDSRTRDRLARLWGLAKRAGALRRFHRQLLDYATARGLGAQETAWRCVEAAPVWYRIAVHEEPPFPLDLCGPDYPLEQLNAEWRAHLQSMTPALVALWRAEAS